MDKIRFGFKLLVATLFLFASNSLIQGQVGRTFVSGTGSDDSPCSRTAPCKTFAGALPKTAAGGEIDAMDASAYGTFNITKAITIDGAGSFAGIRGNANSPAIVINGGPGDVIVLRHLAINGGGQEVSAIQFNTGKALYVEDCLIQGFANYAVDFEPSGEGTLVIRDSIIMNNGSGPTSNLPSARGSGGGILVRSASGKAFATIDNTRADGNFNGIAAKDNSKVTISNSVISRNSAVGLLTASDSMAPAEMNVEHSVVTLNAIGILSGGCGDTTQGTGQATVRISNVSVTSNSSAGLVSACSLPRRAGSAGAIISSRNNTILGNNPDGAPTAEKPQQ